MTVRQFNTIACALGIATLGLGCAGSGAGPSNLVPDAHVSSVDPSIPGSDAQVPPSDASVPRIDADVPPVDVTYPGTPAGHPDATCAVPADARAESIVNPRTVVGSGTPESCTSAAFVAAVAQGGVITFDCGPDPVTITLTETARVFNDSVTSAAPDIVIDGGGKVTLSGGGARRILYMNTCDSAQHWTTSHCDDQDHPQLTVQNLTFVDGNATSASPEGSGGAIYAQGGRLKIVNSRFFRNRADLTGPDVGGGAVRAWMQSSGLPVYVVQSTFGGEALGNTASNGGALSGLGTSYSVINSMITHNTAVGWGANPAQSGTPGGGSGGAIYNDGNTFTLSLCGTEISHNDAVEGGGAIFFVSNDLSGTMRITDSQLFSNPSHGFETQGYPGIFVLASGDPIVTNSTITP